MMQMFTYILNNFIMLILVMINILISVAFLTLFERKILSYIHYRKGPNKVGFIGILQPFSDALKLLAKEFFSPKKSNFNYYLISPMIMFLVIMSLWMIYPFSMNMISMNFNFMFFMCLTSMSVYGLMISGWSSNSMFSMLGAMRSIAQTISYEVILTVSMLVILMMINKINLNYLPMYQKIMWLIIMFWPLSIIMYISLLAEINRTPFDLAEGESELVSGFNLEYSSSGFVLIFLSEYASILFMMFMFSLLLMCKNLFSIFFYLMVIILSFSVIWVRGTLPRIRYDNLMHMCWYNFLPKILILFMFYLLIMKYPLDLIFMMNYK